MFACIIKRISFPYEVIISTLHLQESVSGKTQSESISGSRPSGPTRQVTFRAEIGNVKDAEPWLRVRLCLKWLRKMTLFFFPGLNLCRQVFNKALGPTRGGEGPFRGEAMQRCDSQPPVCSGSRFRGAGAPQLRSIVIRAHPHAALPLITCAEWLDATALTNCLSFTLQHYATEQHVNRQEMDGWMWSHAGGWFIWTFFCFFYKRSPRDVSHPSAFTGGKTWVT